MIQWRRLKHPGFIAALALLVVSGAVLSAAVAALRLYLVKLPIEVEAKVSSVPTVLGEWVRHGPDHQEAAEMVEELGTKNYLTRRYVLNRGAGGPGGVKHQPIALEVHLAYYTGMVDTVPHVPERCMVGGGWSIAGASVVAPVELDSSRWVRDSTVDEKTFGRVHLARRQDGTRIRLPRGVEDLGLRVTVFAQPGSDRKLHAGYFFLANGGIATSAEQVRLQAFQLNDDYAYYLKVQISSAEVGSPEELAEQATLLLNELLPEVMNTVPDWVEVQRGNYPADNPRKSTGKA